MLRRGRADHRRSSIRSIQVREVLADVVGGLPHPDLDKLRLEREHLGRDRRPRKLALPVAHVELPERLFHHIRRWSEVAPQTPARPLSQ